MRRPAGRSDQIAEPDAARLGPGLLDHNHRVALDPARSRGQLGELPFGELGGLGVGLDLLAEFGLDLRLRAPVLHDELAEAQDRLAVEPPFLGEARQRRSGEAFELLEIVEVRALDGQLALEPFGLGRQGLELLIEGPDLGSRVLLDGSGPEPGAQDPKSFRPLGIERAIDRLRRQGRDDQLDGPHAFEDAHLSGDKRLPLIDRHGDDLAPGRSRDGRVLFDLRDIQVGIRLRGDHGPADLRAGQPGHQPE